MKVVKLKKVKQERKMMEEFVQKFRRVAKGINGVIRQKLMEIRIST